MGIQGELLPIIPDPMMELMKFKDADIVDLLDAEIFGLWINVVPSSLLSCVEIHTPRFISPKEMLNLINLPVIGTKHHFTCRAMVSTCRSPLWPASSRFFSGWQTHLRDLTKFQHFLLTMSYKHLNSAPGLHASHWFERSSAPWGVSVFNSVGLSLILVWLGVISAPPPLAQHNSRMSKCVSKTGKLLCAFYAQHDIVRYF